MFPGSGKPGHAKVEIMLQSLICIPGVADNQIVTVFCRTCTKYKCKFRKTFSQPQLLAQNFYYTKSIALLPDFAEKK